MTGNSPRIRLGRDNILALARAFTEAGFPPDLAGKATLTVVQFATETVIGKGEGNHAGPAVEGDNK